MKPIHVGKKGCELLFLVKTGDEYSWVDREEHFLRVKGNSAEEAIRLARKTWQESPFRTLFCGNRFTLPERDEHGQPALFCQMAASLEAFNGAYFDEELGLDCMVREISLEAQELYRTL